MTHSDTDQFDRRQGRRVSEFPSITDFPADTFLTLISGSTNFKISLVDFLASIGVTGTIESTGSGEPIYLAAGSVNQIKSLTPLRGVSVLQNFGGSLDISDGLFFDIPDSGVHQVEQTAETLFFSPNAGQDGNATLKESPANADIVRIFNMGTGDDVNVSSFGGENIIYQGASVASPIAIAPFRSATFRRGPSNWIQESYDPA